MFTSCGTCVYVITYIHEHNTYLVARYGVNLLGVEDYTCVRFLVSDNNLSILLRRNRQSHSHEPRTFCRTVRRVTEAGEVKYLRYGAEGIPSLKRA